MPDRQRAHELGEAATIDILAAIMVERFGSRAVDVAVAQLTAADARDIADRWSSIATSIEDRLRAGQTMIPPALRQWSGGKT